MITEGAEEVVVARTVQKLQFNTDSERRLKNVCAYARVSTGKDSMLHSLSAQVSYYQRYIQSNSEWRFCGVYADEALTGTKDNREEFQKMLAECRKGNIDLIITKSISRFARNTIILLQTVRELKNIGVEIYFEEQNIFSLSTEGEVMLTILASYAQEESLSVSENMKWRIKRNFEEGKPWGMIIYGYRCVDGKLVICPEEAEVVRRIFNDFLAGKGYLAIVKELNQEGIKPRRSDHWQCSSVHCLLTNYAYTGNLVLQKTFRKDHISKKSVKNCGELPMYHAMETHEAIIPMGLFQQVQAEMARRSSKAQQAPKMKYPFTGIIQCPYCGAKYQRRKGSRVFSWKCSTYVWKGKEFCPNAKAIPEDTLNAITGEVLGSENLAGAEIADRISSIDAKAGNLLVFHLKSGTEAERIWEDRSRSASWTAEMRESARQKNYDRRNKK